MPELPEVETVRRGLAPSLEGRRFARVTLRRPDLRFPFPDGFVQHVTGARVEALGRRAKYLLAALSTGETLVMHLGMTGRFRVATLADAEEPGGFYHELPPHPAHDHVVFEMEDGPTVTYNDVRRFGFMTLVPSAALDATAPFAAMGIEPLGPDLDGVRLAALFRGRRTPLKAALLDQRLVAGLGNIYVSEALFRAGLSPEAPAGSIATPAGRPRATAILLATAIRAVLEEAVAVGGSTLRDHAQVDGSAGGFQERFRVYDREGEACVADGCRGVVRRLVQSGRSTFYCPDCQKPPRVRLRDTPAEPPGRAG